MEEEEATRLLSPGKFSLRIVCLDFYMSPPHPSLDVCFSCFQGRPVAEVPIVRIFGTTLTGQKVCLHLHKAFPYFYVPYDEDLPQGINEALTYVRQLASAAEKALKLASTVGAKRQHIHSCSLVRAKKFYGFHSNEQLFVKIVLYHPQEVLRLSMLLLGGGILNRRFQPHESHVPYLLQVMIDNNLAGMGFLHLSDFKLRHPMLANAFTHINNFMPKFQSLAPTLCPHGEPRLPSLHMELWCERIDMGQEECDVSMPEKQTTCELEIDSCVEAIVNRNELLFAPLSTVGSEIKMIPSLLPIWEELGSENEEHDKNKETASVERHVQDGPHTNEFKNALRCLFNFTKETRDCYGHSNEGHQSSWANTSLEDSQIPVGDQRHALLMYTQAAHYNRYNLCDDFVREDASPCFDKTESRTMDSRLKSSEIDAPLDEELIKQQVSESSQDDEAMGLLRWMISSQQEDCVLSYESDQEKEEGEYSWSQIFRTADDALTKALQEYEQIYQQECEAIMECSKGPQEEIASVVNASETSGEGHKVEEIPQFDGAYDEDPSFISITESNPTKAHGFFDSFSTICKKSPTGSEIETPVEFSPEFLEPLKNEHAKEDHKEDESLRDLMRRKRKMKQVQDVSIPLVTSDGTFCFSGPKKPLMDDKADSCKNDFPNVSLKERRPEENQCVKVPSEVQMRQKALGRLQMERESTSRFGLLPFVKRSVLGSQSAINDSVIENACAHELPPFSAVTADLSSTCEHLEMPCSVTADTITMDEELAGSVCLDISKSKEEKSEGFNIRNTSSIGSSFILACKKNENLQVSNSSCELELNNNFSILQNKDYTYPLNVDSWAEGMELNTKYNSRGEKGLLELKYYQKPPTVEYLQGSFHVYDLPSVDHGGVFYGRLEDLPNQPLVMAGLMFEAKSIEVESLKPFHFGDNANERTSMRIYASSDMWMPTCNDESTSGLPSHFENDGTVLNMITPAKLPPTWVEVCRWLKEQSMTSSSHYETIIEQSGQSLVYISNSQCSWTERGSLAENSLDLQVPSPKYDDCQMRPCQILVNDQSLTGFPDPFVQNVRSLLEAEPFCANSGRRVPQLKDISRRDISQISGHMSGGSHFTPVSQSGFRDPASAGCAQHISVMCVEAFASTRGDLLPDPRYDAINCIVAVIGDDKNGEESRRHTVVLLFERSKEAESRNIDAITADEVIWMKDEISLFYMFIWLVRIYDPDLVVGWEVQGLSLGLLAERAANIGIGLLREISRTPLSKNVLPMTEKDATKAVHIESGMTDMPIINDEWGRTHGSGIYITGRIVLNLWRVMLWEVKLRLYSLEAVAEAVLKKKVPSIPWRTLTSWFASGPGGRRYRCIEYFMKRAHSSLQIMEQLDLINRTSELARIFGIDFYSVLSRGSQYRVESMMLRLAHSQNFLAISPSRQQVASQPAMQCLPLVMEPESRFYTDPVVVLDFQSLYPSMMIAYNLCFSTCLGNLVPDIPKVLGVTELNLHPDILNDIKDDLIFTPNGVIFVSPKIRPGVLPRLLDEILSTRIMVKKAMKQLKSTQKVKQRVQNARQLALKLISNVTYGYTAAGFSGRMPCAELADSIVQSGRCTLERAITFVNTHPQWRAWVVYGDTDSMFVLLKGRTIQDAFKIGEEIATTITAMNPHPVTLKLEKVYHPCVLLTKKRYVGYSYESPKQVKPIFDAKGIETVRRDSCVAVAKTLEKTLRILFETRDVSQVKSYLQRQWGKIMNGRISVRDFIFAKEVRLGTYSSRASVLPPSAIVATKAMSVDPRAEPRYGERVQYVVVHGEPGARLIDMVVDPHALLDVNSTYRLHDTYYITKQIIPALQRVFGLVGVDIVNWYNEMPRPVRPLVTKRIGLLPPFSKSETCSKSYDKSELQSRAHSKRTIDHYYLSQHCVVCGALIHTSSRVCGSCSGDKVVITMTLVGRLSRLEREFKHLQAICGHCGGGDEIDMEEGVGCNSLACAVFFERVKVQKEYKSTAAVVGTWMTAKGQHNAT